MIQVHLQPEIEAKLLDQARTQGLHVDQYLANLVIGMDDEEQGMREGLADITAGRTRPADEVFAELFERHGIQG